MSPREYQASIYAKTDQGTYYWSEPNGSFSNYIINTELSHNIDSRLPRADSRAGRRDQALDTAGTTFKYGQDGNGDRFESLNPQNCR